MTYTRTEMFERFLDDMKYGWSCLQGSYQVDDQDQHLRKVTNVPVIVVWTYKEAAYVSGEFVAPVGEKLSDHTLRP